MLGLWQDMAAVSQPVLAIDITDSTLETPFRPVFLQYQNLIAQGKPASFIVEHQPIEQPLKQAILDNSKIDIFDNTELANFDASGACNQLRLKDGRELHARLLVGADGRGSAVREMAGIKTVGWDYPQSGLVTTVHLSKPHGAKAVQHFLPSGPFAILPMTENRASLVWTEEREIAEALLADSEAQFVSEINKRFAPKLGEVSLAGARLSFPLSMHLAREYVKPRVALLGDSAHGVHPIAGQGLNIGLRDVAALAQIIIETNRLGLDIGSMEPLTRYAGWRRFDSTLSNFTFDGLNHLFSNDNNNLRQLRSFGLRVVDRVPPLKAFFVKEAAGLTGDIPRLMRGEVI